MSSKGEDSTEEKPAKRPRLGALKQQGYSVAAAAVMSFGSLNPDCLAHILSFLENDEMNAAALINSAFREARNDPSLDQTRTAIITVKTEAMTFPDLLKTIVINGWSQFFTVESNYKCLKIVGARPLSFVDTDHTHRPIRDRDRVVIGGSLFQSVTNLDLSPRAGNDIQDVSSAAILTIVAMCPNLLHVDLSYVRTMDSVILAIATCKPNLRGIKCNGSSGVYFGEVISPRDVGNLIEIQLDDSVILGPQLCSDLSETETYLYTQCHRLERVSMKNATWKLHRHAEAVPFPQNILIKLVRYHPTLRWLRSDLTDANIAMLKQERPDVTLINK